VEIRQQIDGEQSDRKLRGLHDTLGIDDWRESPVVLPQPAQLEQQVLIELTRFADDLVVRAAGDGVDRLAKCAQRALIGELDRDHDGDAHGDSKNCERRPQLLVDHRTQDERASDHRDTRPSSTRTM